MKRLFFLLCLLVLSISVSAYTGFSGVSTAPTDLEVEKGSNWKMKFELVPSTNDVSIHNHSIEGNETSVSGTIMLRDGCSEPEYNFSKTSENTYRLEVYSVDNADPGVACTQQVRYQGYESSIEAERPYTLTVENEGANFTEIVNEKESENKGLMNWFRKLFS